MLVYSTERRNSATTAAAALGMDAKTLWVRRIVKILLRQGYCCWMVAGCRGKATAAAGGDELDELLLLLAGC